MSLYWQIYLVFAYIIGAYVLRSEVKPDEKLTNDHLAGLAAAFLISPVWVWWYVGSFIIDKSFSVLGRWISGQ